MTSIYLPSNTKLIPFVKSCDFADKMYSHTLESFLIQSCKKLQHFSLKSKISDNSDGYQRCGSKTRVLTCLSRYRAVYQIVKQMYSHEYAV